MMTIDELRSLPVEEQVALFEAQALAATPGTLVFPEDFVPTVRPDPQSVPVASPTIDPAVRDSVLNCPHRGPEGGLVLLEDELACCGSGDERTACAAGKGARPGRVTLRECLACRA